MKTNKFNKLLFLAIAFAFSIVSCSKDDEGGIDASNFPNGAAKVNLKATASYPSSTGKGSAFGTAKASIEVSEFLVNIREIELEFDDDDDDRSWNGSKHYGHDDDLKLKGPFELDLLGGEIVFATVDLPRGRYEELEFDFDKNRDSNSPLFGKTILVKGLIDGVPFEFWHDFEEDLEIDFEDANRDILIDNNNGSIVINFNLTGIFNQTDLSKAQDGNADGLIEISPRDDDGNRNLAKELKERIKDYIDLLDD